MAGKEEDPNAIISLKPFHKVPVTVAGGAVRSEPINMAYYRGTGRHAVQYEKAGAGKLKLTYEVSVNGEKYGTPVGAYPVVEEAVAADDGFGELRPAMAPYLILIAEAVGGDIPSLEVWLAVQ